MNGIGSNIYLLFIVLFLLPVSSCAKKEPGVKEDLNIVQEDVRILMNKPVNDSISFESAIKLMESDVLDSLSFEQKKEFIIRLITSHGWQIDSSYNENTGDSIYRHTDIKDYIRLSMWLYNVDSISNK